MIRWRGFVSAVLVPYWFLDLVRVPVYMLEELGKGRERLLALSTAEFLLWLNREGKVAVVLRFGILGREAHSLTHIVSLVL